MKTQLNLLLALLLLAPLAHSETRYLHAGSLLAIPGEEPLREQTLVIRDGLITDVQAGYQTPENGERVVDLKHAFVLPGLMDMHVHLDIEFGARRVLDEVQLSKELIQMRSIHFGMQTLLAGFTTVRDMSFLYFQEIYALRDSIERGWVDGPRIVAAGRVGTTASHSDISGLRPDLTEFLTGSYICDGPFDCRRVTREVIKYGADLIKITSTGGVMTDRATGTGQQMEQDELDEVVHAAARLGRKVAAHAHEEEGIIAALDAGVASIEHGTFVGPKGIRAFRKTGAYLVPTLLAGDTARQLAEAGHLSEAQSAKAIQVSEAMKGNFARAWKAGVNVAYGTDSGVSKHGTNAREAVLMVKAGMTPMEVIESATVSAAALIDMSEELGTLEPGKHADIIAVDESPLEDIEALLDVDFVMKGGKIYKQ
jgi:imidazolonepropionase-like amidohydrolase